MGAQLGAGGVGNGVRIYIDASVGVVLQGGDVADKLVVQAGGQGIPQLCR